MNEQTPPGASPVDQKVMAPNAIIDLSIKLTGLAESMHIALSESQVGDDFIRDAQNIAWGYEALAHLAQCIANDVAEYAP